MGHYPVPSSSVSLYLFWIFEQHVKSAIYLWPLLKVYTAKNVFTYFPDSYIKVLKKLWLTCKLLMLNVYDTKECLFRSLKRWRNFEKIVKQYSLHDAILIYIYFLCPYILVKGNINPNCFFFLLFFFLPSFSSSFFGGGDFHLGQSLTLLYRLFFS